MVTYVYICNACCGEEEARTFELGYPDMRTAENAPAPLCPTCGSPDGVARFFRHRFYAPGKSSQRDHGKTPDRFVELDPARGKGIVSIGIRVDAEDIPELERRIKETAEEAGLEIIERKRPAGENGEPAETTADSGAESGGGDFTEEVLGLKPGSLERALFDIRHNRMMEDLHNGAPISGFFLPISGEYNN